MKATTANLNYIKHNHYDWPLQIVLQMQLLFLDFCLTKNKAYKSILPSKQKALDKLKHNKKETKNKKKRKKKTKKQEQNLQKCIQTALKKIKT